MRKSVVNLLAAAAAYLAAQEAVRAEINLELRPIQTQARADASFDIGLYAVSDNASNQPLSAMDVILEWDPSVLQLIGRVNNGPYSWFMSAFTNDSGADGLNNTFDDGDAYYTALAQFGTPAQATPAGLLVTTLQFTALAPSPESTVSMPLNSGTFSQTAVYGYPNVAQIVTGLRVSATFVVCGAAADGDLNQDGAVNGLDVQVFHDAMFSESHLDAHICHGDFNNDGSVDHNDINDFVVALLDS